MTLEMQAPLCVAAGWQDAYRVMDMDSLKKSITLGDQTVLQQTRHGLSPG